MTLEISLPSGIIADYVNFLFPKDRQSGEYLVSAANDVGRVIIGYVKPVNHRPAEKSQDEGKVTMVFRLPDGDSTQHLRNKWLDIRAGDEARLAAFIKAYFDVDLLSYYLAASSMGFQKKEALRKALAAVSSKDETGVLSEKPCKEIHEENVLTYEM